MKSKKALDLLREWRQLIVYIIAVIASKYFIENITVFATLAAIYGIAVAAEVLYGPISLWRKIREQLKQNKQEIIKIYKLSEKMISLDIFNTGHLGSLRHYLEIIPNGLHRRYFSRVLEELEVEVRNLYVLSKYFSKHSPRFSRDVNDVNNVVSTLKDTLYHVLKKLGDVAEEFENAPKDPSKCRAKKAAYREFLRRYEKLVDIYREYFGEDIYHTLGDLRC